jgi:hypothetical protein
VPAAAPVAGLTSSRAPVATPSTQPLKLPGQPGSAVGLIGAGVMSGHPVALAPAGAAGHGAGSEFVTTFSRSQQE